MLTQIDRASFRTLTPRRVVMLLTLFAIAARLPYFNAPVQADEACTYTWYCTPSDHPVWYAATHYPGPHNHVLHSVMVAALYAVFGCGLPWLRLPAFVAGVACVPVAFLVFRRMIGGRAAFIAALILALSGWSIRYSTDARGYSLQTLLGLVAVGQVCSGARAHNQRRLAIGGLLAGLGLYAVPTTCTLVAAATLWLLASAQQSENSPRFDRCRNAGLFLMVALATAGLLYAPMLSHMGHDVLWRHASVGAIEFGETLARIGPAIHDGLAAASDAVVPYFLFVALLICGTVRAAQSARRPAGLLLFQLLVLIPQVLLTRRVPPARTLIFLAPYAQALAAIGLLACWNMVARWRHMAAFGHSRSSAAVGVTCVALLMMTNSAIAYVERWPVALPGVDDVPDALPVARFLAKHNNANDFVFAQTGISEPIQYHLARLGCEDQIVGVPRHAPNAEQALLVRQRGRAMGEALTRAMATWQVGESVLQADDFEVLCIRPRDRAALTQANVRGS